MIEDKNLPKLPDGWLYITLDEISEKITDGSHNPPPKQTKGVPMLSARNINNNHIDFEKIRYIKDEDFDREYKRAPVEPRDVLLTIVGTIGRSAVVEKNTPPFSFQRSVALIKPKINPNYLCYYFQSIFCHNYLLKNSKGTAQKGIYLNQLKKLPTPLCPLEEQNRIVLKIEEIFTKLDASIIDLKKAKAQLYIYRQLIINKWTNGKIVEKYDSISLGDLIEPSKERINPTEIKNDVLNYIGLEHIEKETGKLLEHGHSNQVRSLKTVFHQGDLLYGRLRPYLNKTCVPDFKGICSTDILVFPKQEQINNKYIMFNFLSNKFVRYATQNMSGVQHPRVNYKTLSKYQIVLPPLKEQNRIVDEIERHLTISVHTVKSINENLTSMEILKKIILNKALEGKLVPQDPSDEPAEVLLKRIQKESGKYEQMRLI